MIPTVAVQMLSAQQAEAFISSYKSARKIARKVIVIKTKEGDLYHAFQFSKSHVDQLVLRINERLLKKYQPQ